MCGFWLSLCFVVAAEPTAESPADIFTRRIVPIVQSSRASSCTECHFGGVDLKQYVLDDAAQTFAALRGAGLVDVDRPTNSKLLTFINRKPEKEDPVLAKVRAEEYEAFKSWIEAAVRDPAILAASTPAKKVGPETPLEVVRHGRHDRVLQSFIENIWVENERCENCHSGTKNRRQVAEHGEQITWMHSGDPAATLATIIAHDLIDVEQPEKSLLLLKPLGVVKHAGHIKFPVGGRTDQQFRRFLSDYAAIVKGTYRTVADLPPPTTNFNVPTGQHLRITDVPEEFAGRLLRVDLYAEAEGGPGRLVGTADGRIRKPEDRVWQNTVFAILPRDENAARTALTKRLLPASRYFAKIYVDRNGRVEKDRDAVLDESECVGTIEFDGPWPAGYQPPKIISAANLRAP